VVARKNDGKWSERCGAKAGRRWNVDLEQRDSGTASTARTGLSPSSIRGSESRGTSRSLQGRSRIPSFGSWSVRDLDERSRKMCCRREQQPRGGAVYKAQGKMSPELMYQRGT
jgi:hypothetical protein